MGSSRTNKFPDDVILDTAVLTVMRSPDGEAAPVRTKVGASRGGLEFDPGVEIRTLQYDGQRHKKAGHDRTTGWDSKFTGTMLELSADTAAMLESGATITDTAAVVGPPAVPATRKITPKSADALFAIGDYVEGPRLTWLRGNGGTFSVCADYGKVTQYKIGSKDKDEGEVPITIEHRAAPDADDAEAPFWFEITGPDIDEATAAE